MDESIKRLADADNEKFQAIDSFLQDLLRNSSSTYTLVQFPNYEERYKRGLPAEYILVIEIPREDKAVLRVACPGTLNDLQLCVNFLTAGITIGLISSIEVHRA